MLALNPIQLTNEDQNILMDVASLCDRLDYEEEVLSDCSDDSDGNASDGGDMTNSHSDQNISEDAYDK